MKRSNWLLVLVLLIVVAGVVVFWPRSGVSRKTARAAALAAPVNVAPPRAGAALGKLGTATNQVATVNTNKLAYRLSNTTNSLRKLEAMPHVLLLANAFIDTEKPLDLKIPAHLQAKGDPGAYIVQARGTINAPFRTALMGADAQIVSYIPNNAYLVNVTASGAAALRGNPLVQAVLPYEPYYKLQSSLLGLAVEKQPLPPGTALTLGLFAGSASQAKEELGKMHIPVIGPEDQSPFGPVLRVLPPADWTSILQLSVVKSAELVHPRRLANDLTRVAMGVSTDTLVSSNYLNLYGSNVLVAVNDTGIDTNHPDFGFGGTPASPDTVPPSRVTGLTYLDMVDTNGHGTHVAGIIAGNGSQSITPTNVGTYAEGSIPNADFRGKAPQARLFSMDYGRYSDYRLQTNAAMIGALVCNNSWGYGGDYDYDLAAASYDYATRDALPFTTGSQPVLYVFAAGNDGGGQDDGQEGNSDTIVSPGTAKNVITVGALELPRYITNLVTYVTGSGTNITTNQVAYWQTMTDSGSQVAWYSSRGNVGIGTEGNYGRFKPDVVAPGTMVVSTRSGQWDTNAYYNPTNDIQQVFLEQFVDTNGLTYYNVTVPANAVGVYITITPDKFSPSPFPDLTIYCQQSGYPNPVNAPGSIDLTTYTNGVAIPPGGGNCTIPSLQNNGFAFAVGNTNSFSVVYDLTVDVLTTNTGMGDLYAVLQGMNDSLGGYYRYESGTSMATPAVSGTLALIQDYLTNQFTPAVIPSPALMKALLINGARSVAKYPLAFTNDINFQGWGLDNLTNCIPVSGLFNQYGPEGSCFFADQSPASALATGDRHNYTVTLDQTNNAQGRSFRAVLVWTDPPGDPSAAIKLVNNLDLVITNLDTGEVYFGNDISSSLGYNQPWNTNTTPNLDTINNVESVVLKAPLASKYSVTVLGRSVNVNAVTAQTNNALGQYAPNIVQDYALVVSVGEGEVTNAFKVTDGGIVSNPTSYQDITAVMTTNAPLTDQIVGENSPELGTNQLALGNDTVWGPNGVVTIGQTNQWHFYVVTNTGKADFTNAAFITYDAFTLSVPRMGVVSDSANATRAEADIDLYVTQDPSITNLSPVAIAGCLAGTTTFGVGNAGASVSQGGTEFVFFTNSAPGQVYYVGVKSEDHQAAEYSFLPIFTDVPFSGLDQEGNQIVHGLLLPMAIPDGRPTHPGATNVFALAIIPMEVEKVVVTNLDEHQNFGDLYGVLSFGGAYAVLNSHDAYSNTIGSLPIVYDDSAHPQPGSTVTDGPGSLVDFRRKSALGPWRLGIMDNSPNYTGQVSVLTLKIQPHRNLKQPGVIVSIPPGGWFVDFVDVPAGYTNLTFYATNVSTTVATPAIQMYERYASEPTLTEYDQEADLTNGVPPGNSISVGPPLAIGEYFIGLYNPSSQSQNVFISATLGASMSAADVYNYAAGPNLVADDAVADNTIIVPNTVTQLVASVNVGMVIDTPRISDYAITLVSPLGQRVLLMENRGGNDTNGAGMVFVYTNTLSITATGGAAPNTNYLAVTPGPGTVPILWEFYNVPDQMTVYDTTNPAAFDASHLVYDTGFASNGPAGGPYPWTSASVAYPAGVSNLTIIMNQYGNPYSSGGDAWDYTAGVPMTNFEYLEFTDDTNLASVPIKFAATPFSFVETSSNYKLSDLDLAPAGDYRGMTNISDGYGGWTVPTNVVTISTLQTNGQFVLVTNVLLLTNNLVSVVADPATCLSGDVGGSNYLALGNGMITRTIPTVAGRTYNVTFWYRGPGIDGWWRGEGNGNDSSDPENLNNNGTLFGRFNFPAGEVEQALSFEDNGNRYQFAGTNTYVQMRASSSLNVGAGGGFTVEGWINPTNLTRPQPLVEWLAKVPTNSAADANLTIVQGPMLNPWTSHYYYLLGATNWAVSEAWAQALGGHLATVNTANEENWIYDMFTAYGTTNRYLWVGLTNTLGTTFGWLNGSNVTYVNWLSTQPANCDGGRNYTLILSPTNAYPGLWALADTNGSICGSTATNQVYGVVEVESIPTNGVQFWICGTNWTSDTNNLQGCLAANIVDTNYVSHWIYSAPGLLTSNVYQHVALTFNTNSGVAALFLNGTNVATSNLYSAGVSFTPKADGDVLLGYDMSLYTNNFYGGAMDEMSIYGRTLSDAEISAIYWASAGTTNRMIGKFDPLVTPAVGLAEAVVLFGSASNVIYGVNNRWELDSYTFTAVTNSMTLTIAGVAPGILLDDFTVSEAPLTNLYYFPETELSVLQGTPAAGRWTLEIWDNRAGAYVTNAPQLVNWELSFVLQSNAVVSAALPPETPVTTTVPPGLTTYYSVTVPAWAHEATNMVVSSTEPVTVFYYSPTNPPGGIAPPDATLLSGVSSYPPGGVLITNTPAIPLQPNQTYYLGVRNNNAHAAEVVLEVDYDMVDLTNGVPYSDLLTNEYSSAHYFTYEVSSNAYEATFQLLKLSGNADLVVRKGAPLPVVSSADYASYNNSTSDENIYVLTNSTVPLSPGRWFIGVLNRDGSPLQYSVLAKELDLANGIPVVIPLTNDVPFTWTAGPGAALTNFFSFYPTNALVNATNGLLHGVRFELFNLSGNVDLTVQTNELPPAPPFFQTSQNGGTTPELVFIYTNNVLTDLAKTWYLGVPNHEVTNVTYTVIAEILTNLYFPAFPDAQGAGGGAIGGRGGDVYHVTATSDSGPGSLREAVNTAKTGRTVVFDIAGTINLQTPLVITNSCLTLAGETSPGGGIGVAGQMTLLTNVHDVVIRDVRFRPSSFFAGSGTNFDGVAAADYTVGNQVAGWTVVSNQCSVVADQVNARTGHKNFLALASGIISNNLSTVPGKTYSMSLTYRGPGIVGWWRGENSLNSSIYGNNPTANQNISYIGGEVGNALSFNSGLITIPSSSSLAVTNVTVEGWIKPTTTSYEPVVDWGGAGQNSALHFWVNGWGLSPQPGTLYANVRPKSPELHSAGGVVPQNTWTHVAFTMDCNSGALIIYCNGANVANTTMSPLPVTTPTAGQPLNLGYRDQGSADALSGYRYTGGMDELSVYNRALSPSELKAICNRGSAGKFDPALFVSSPEQSLAEAALTIPGLATNVCVGNNTNWQTQTIVFTATGSSTPVLVSGIEPGMLLDSVVVSPDVAGSLQLNTVSNVIADHVSISWNTNADLAVLASTNVTVQWSIMADSFYVTNKFNGLGSVLRKGSGTLSFHHNLYADNFSANPRLGDNLTLDFVNNVIYNWGGFSTLAGGTNDFDLSPGGCTNELNYICNYLIAGPDTALWATNYAITNIAYFGGGTNASAANWVFQTNNFIDSDTNGVLNGANTGWGMFTNAYTRFAREFPAPPVSVDEAYKGYEKVLAFAGVNLALRDPADTNIVTKVRLQSGRIINAVPASAMLASKLPYLDTDQDGIPDFWELTFTPTNVYIPSQNNDRDGDGYTDLEEYNNWLAVPHALTTVTNPVAVDLYQLCGESGHLAFYVTNAVHGTVYLTNIIGTITNTSSLWSNTVAVFTPANNYHGYASFDAYVTNLDTEAYFGPVTVSVVVSAAPITINSNMPPVITPLTSGVADPTNYGGSDFYSIVITTNIVGAVFEIDQPTGPMAMVISSNLPLPSLSSYLYYTNAPSAPANMQITVLTNSLPTPLTPGTWYMAAVNISGSNVVYSAKITLLTKLLPPQFLFPTNTTITNILETVPWSVSCVATDLDNPPLSLTYTLMGGPAGMTLTNNALYWTPTEAQGPSANTVKVSVSNGAFSVTNTFTVDVWESNLPPVLPTIPDQVIIPPATLVVTNTATDTDIPTNALTYTLTTDVPANVPGANQPVIDTNGIITWTPTLALAGTNYLFTTVVTDTNPWAVNAQSLSATNRFHVLVVPPLPPGGPTNIVVPPNSLMWYAVAVPTNAIAATNRMSATLPLNLWYSTNQPPTITTTNDSELLYNITNGVRVLYTNLATAPTNLVPGGVYFLGLQNTGGIAVTASLEVDFAYPVPPLPVNFSISQTNFAGTNGYLLVWYAPTNEQFHLQWTPSLSPAWWTNFNGVISYTTLISATNSRFQYLDNGTQTGGFGTNRFYRLLLLNSPSNTAPYFLHAFGVQYAPPSALFQITNAAADWDVPGQTLAYSVSNSLALPGIAIDASGVISWTPTPALAGQTNIIVTTVADNGLPAMSAANSITVIVGSAPAPVFSSITMGTNGVAFKWTASTNEQFQVRWTTNLTSANWLVFPGTIISTTGTFNFVDTNTPLQAMKFYQLILLP